MTSNSLINWRTARRDALDQIKSAHAIVGGTHRGRRYATLQINYAYAALLSSHFQRFCRDLHSECIDHLVAATPANFQAFLRMEFLWSRSLDRGNPNPGAIGNDSNRLGVSFWQNVYDLDQRNARRRELLEELNRWRNAIAHQDFNPVGGNSNLRLATVRNWERALNALSQQFDRAMQDYLATVLGNPAW